MVNIVLSLLKVDLGINHDLRDEYLSKLIEGSRKELECRGVALNLENTEDIMLLSDYSAWVYRKRMENVPLAQNLQHRIRNRQVRGRASSG